MQRVQILLSDASEEHTKAVGKYLPIDLVALKHGTAAGGESRRRASGSVLINRPLSSDRGQAAQRRATTLRRATASPSRATSSASSASMVEWSARPSTRARRKWRWNAVTIATVASS
jgi:hypothetical protein